tara:strand:+ start:754 stop:1224 length:471 start_codon:yes stop_codon:yes gene_type:complete
MKRLDKAKDFIEYISKKMERDDLHLLYRINNITKERIELFYDFVYSLNELVITTYLGDEITTKEDRDKHFKWCWEKVIDGFKKEGIYFITVTELYNYFITFFQESFYEEKIKTTRKSNKLKSFWTDLFSFSKVKTMSEYESLLELYKIFNRSFMVN